MVSEELITVEELRHLVGTERLCLFDAREPEAYDEGHIPGAVNLHPSELESTIVLESGEEVPSQLRSSRAGRTGRDWRSILDPFGDRVYGTINCNVVTPDGDLAGVTTTSGLAFKIPGRVGDSPILGAGLYVDNAVARRTCNACRAIWPSSSCGRE